MPTAPGWRRRCHGLLFSGLASWSLLTWGQDKVPVEDAAYLAALAGAIPLALNASGALAAAGTATADAPLTPFGSRFHAQLARLDGANTQQIVIIEQDRANHFRRFAQSAPITGIGGSSNWRIADLYFAHGSLYVAVAYHWHGCEGSARSQFRLDHGRLVMAGNESTESRLETGTIVTSSTNLLTGKGFWTSQSAGRQVRHTAGQRLLPQAFSDYDSTGWISPYHQKRPVCSA